ncbi:hypothetical protein [Photobacterium kasasachensis]|uniref:hypothetical protein n=1 Tax=Photobacterium kasasachensis TaxID=2910240 RepID=UPI003D0E4570
MNSSDPNTLDSMIQWLKNNKWIAPVIFAGVVVIALSQFTEAIDKLYKIIGAQFKQDNFHVEGDIIIEPGAESGDNLKVTVYWEKDDFPNEGYQSPAVVKLNTESGRLSFRLDFKEPPAELNLIPIPHIGQLCYRKYIDINGNEYGKLSQRADRDYSKCDTSITLPPDNSNEGYEQSFFGVGIIIAFDDVNNNGLFDKGDIFIENCGDFAITYSRGDLNKSGEWLASRYNLKNKILPEEFTFKSGFSLVRVVRANKEDDFRFDKLVPIENRRINLIINRDKSKVKWPNWT